MTFILGSVMITLWVEISDHYFFFFLNSLVPISVLAEKIK